MTMQWSRHELSMLPDGDSDEEEQSLVVATYKQMVRLLAPSLTPLLTPLPDEPPHIPPLPNPTTLRNLPCNLPGPPELQPPHCPLPLLRSGPNRRTQPRRTTHLDHAGRAVADV